MSVPGEEMACGELLGQMGGNLPCLRNWKEADVEEVFAPRSSQRGSGIFWKAF